jgi:NADH:ubiquinone oxidoreductase subunit E/ferredoxin
MPILIMVSLLFVVTILLAIADKLLVSYGECRISVKKQDEEKEFVVQGGSTLLAALIDNGMKIPASCGGRGSCGYCKVSVRSGGGQVLPTEELFISKDEQRLGTRLACQVKVKNDLEIFVPDLLTTVKAMVKNGTFDTKLKWRFVRKKPSVEAAGAAKLKKLDRKDQMKVDEIIEKHAGMDGAIMPVLQEVNNTFNYLPEPVVRTISKNLDMPLSTVFRIATFYNAFSLEPRGTYFISVCMGTACHVKGAADILSTFEDRLGIKAGQTSEDMLFTLDAVRCIGCCGLGPVLTVNEDVHGLMTRKKVAEIVEMYRGR